VDVAAALTKGANQPASVHVCAGFLAETGSKMPFICQSRMVYGADRVTNEDRRARTAADALDPPSLAMEQDETLDPANEAFARQAKRHLKQGSNRKIERNALTEK
jgi:hypothetical protein